MTKRQLQARLDTLLGKPAAAAPAPWYAEAPPIAVEPMPVRAAVPPKPAAPRVRSWTHTGNGVSGAGYPWMAFTTTTKNGGTFRVTIPADLIAFLRGR